MGQGELNKLDGPKLAKVILNGSYVLKWDRVILTGSYVSRWARRILNGPHVPK